MLWFYTRDSQSLSLETRYDNQACEYVGVLKHPDGRVDTRRFQTADAFRVWLLTVEQDLLTLQWAQDGPVRLVPDGWPDQKPHR
jgi:hypothetical protein